MGLRVCAVDTGAEKRELCFKLGAERWVDFKESKDIVADIKAACDGQGPHAAVVTAATSKAYEQAIDYLRPGGYLMVVGLPAKAALSADIFFTVVKGISILGSYVGNRQDAYEALDIAARGKVKVHFVSKPLSALKEYVLYVLAQFCSFTNDTHRTYEGMEKGNVVGRVVLDFKA